MAKVLDGKLNKEDFDLNDFLDLTFVSVLLSSLHFPSLLTIPHNNLVARHLSEEEGKGNQGRATCIRASCCSLCSRPVSWLGVLKANWWSLCVALC